MVEAFSATGQGKHREGFVVRFGANGANEWVGNFQPGVGGRNGVFEDPNGTALIVIAGGQGHIVDPTSRQCSATFGAQIQSAFEIPDRKMIIFGNGLWFEAIDASGLVWRSDRISWDGMRDITIDGLTLAGEAFDISDNWVPFELDITSGTFTGGSYNGPDRRNR